MSSQATIVDRTRIGNSVPSEQDYALSITTTDLSRTLNIGSNWTRIRVAFRHSISASSATNILLSQPQWAMGLCNGTGSTYTTSGSHFVGMDLDPQYYLFSNSGNTWYGTSQAGVSLETTRRYITKINGVRTTYGSAIADTVGAYRTSGSVNRTLSFIDFIKQTSGSNSAIVDPGLWLIKYGSGAVLQSGTSVYDISSSLYYAQVSNDTASTAYMTNIQQQNVPVSESINGPLTTINIYWSHPTTPLEISDIAVWRFA